MPHNEPDLESSSEKTLANFANLPYELVEHIFKKLSKDFYYNPLDSFSHFHQLRLVSHEWKQDSDRYRWDQFRSHINKIEDSGDPIDIGKRWFELFNFYLEADHEPSLKQEVYEFLLVLLSKNRYGALYYNKVPFYYNMPSRLKPGFPEQSILWNDPEIMRIACRKTPENFCFLGATLLSNRQFMKEVISYNAEGLVYLPPAFRSDKELVLSAIKNSQYSSSFGDLPPKYKYPGWEVDRKNRRIDHIRTALLELERPLLDDEEITITTIIRAPGLLNVFIDCDSKWAKDNRIIALSKLENEEQRYREGGLLLKAIHFEKKYGCYGLNYLIGSMFWSENANTCSLDLKSTTLENSCTIS